MTAYLNDLEMVSVHWHWSTQTFALTEVPLQDCQDKENYIYCIATAVGIAYLPNPLFHIDELA